MVLRHTRKTEQTYPIEYSGTRVACAIGTSIFYVLDKTEKGPDYMLWTFCNLAQRPL